MFRTPARSFLVLVAALTLILGLASTAPASAATTVDTDIFQARAGIVKINTEAPRYTHVRYLVDGKQVGYRRLVPGSGELFDGVVTGSGQFKVCVQHRRTSRDAWRTVDCDYEQVWSGTNVAPIGTVLRY